MASIYTHQDSNIRKTWILMFVFFAIVILIGCFFSLYFNSPIILYVAVFFSVFMNIFSYWNSDKIVIKMTGAKPVNRDSNRELWNIVENLSITAGLTMPKLYIVEDSAPNAFATGRNPDHAVVAVTSGLLQILNKNELEGVIAHELSHIGNRDMLVATVSVVLVGFIAMLADIFLRMTYFGGGRRDNDSRVGVILFVIGIVASILAPIAARLIHLAISRKREFLADASGALLTRYPEGLASALEKISQNGRAMKKTSHATAHLFIANPFGAQAKKSINKFFSSHPPVEDRVKALRGN